MSKGCVKFTFKKTYSILDCPDIREDFSKFIAEEEIVLDKELFESSVKQYHYENGIGTNVIIEFMARKRTDDDDQRERIEYMIENISA